MGLAGAHSVGVEGHAGAYWVVMHRRTESHADEHKKPPGGTSGGFLASQGPATRCAAASPGYSVTLLSIFTSAQGET